MFKWLSILIIVLCGFLVVLLALGYLLKENEIATSALKKELEQEQTKQQQQAEAALFADESKLLPQQKQQQDRAQAQKQAVINNLTCISDQQCVVIANPIEDGSCLIAVNTIGASLLAKLTDKQTLTEACRATYDHAAASCQNNICTVK